MTGRLSLDGASTRRLWIAGSWRLAFFLAAVALYALTPVVFAQPVAQPADAQAQPKEKPKDVVEAMAVCDKGAAVPLDPEAKSRPISYFALLPEDFNLDKLKPLVEACEKAKAGATEEKRFRLQALRLKMVTDFRGSAEIVPELRQLANEGSAEARFLMFHLFSSSRTRGQDVALGIDRAEALQQLEAAVAAGHQTAMLFLSSQYQSGPLYRRDPAKAFELQRKAQNAPQQGPQPAQNEDEMRAGAALTASEILLGHDGLPGDEQKAAFTDIEARTKAGTDSTDNLIGAYVDALRYGRGVEKDQAKARSVLAARVAAGDKYLVPRLADMMALGEGGPVDAKGAIAMLRAPDQLYVFSGAPVLARLLLDGKVVGRQPVEAIRNLARANDIDSDLMLAGLLLDYRPRLDNAKEIAAVLKDAAAVGEPGAPMALARLKLSDNYAFADPDGARALLKPLADSGDKDALWLFASSQYANLDTNSYQPRRHEDGLSDAELKTLIEQGLKDKRPEAYLLAAKLMRRGALYPQDDAAATRSLISAANLGSVEAMVLLGDAYDDGLGIDKNPRERLHAWREAARRGSLKAREKLAGAFTFDSFDKLMTLREGVTERIALYNDGVGRSFEGMGGMDASVSFSGTFSMGSRAQEAGVSALATAVMDGFRVAPAGLEERNLVGIGKALPDEVRIEIEKRLKAEGFYAGEAKGYLGPDARKALAAWVDARGPALDEPAGASAAPAPTVATEIALPAKDATARVSDWALKAGNTIKTKEQRTKVIRVLNVLARSGDTSARWAIVSNYHEADFVRNNVTPAEVTRYALDLMVSRPQGLEKLDFAVTFDLAEIYNKRAMPKFAEAVLAALRDDPRLQDPLTFGGIAKSFVFAPGACDALLSAGKAAGLSDMGDDGCEEKARSALIAYAKSKGPAGVDQEARKAATTDIVAIDERLTKGGSPLEADATPPQKRGKAR